MSGAGGGSSKTTSQVSPYAGTSFQGGSRSGFQQQNQTTTDLTTALQNISQWFQNQQSQQEQQQEQQKNIAASPYAAPLAASGMTDIGAGQQLTQTSAAQMLEALRTGGVNAFIPWIQRAVDSVRQGGSQGVQSLRQQLATGGFGSTLAGQAQLAQAQQQTAQQVASTPSDLIQSWITQAPGYGAQLT